jgi:hypothetical protein
MDGYGVITIGSWLLSIPGLLFWLLGIFIILVWSSGRPLWEFFLSVVMFNIGWSLLGLSFWIPA